MGSKFDQAQIDVIHDTLLEVQMLFLGFYIKLYPEKEAYIRREFEEVQRVERELEQANPGHTSWFDVKKRLPNNGWVRCMDQMAEVMRHNPMPKAEEERGLVAAAKLIRSEARKRLKGRHLN